MPWALIVLTVLLVVYYFTVKSINQLALFELFVVRDLMLFSVLLKLAVTHLRGKFLCWLCTSFTHGGRLE